MEKHRKTSKGSMKDLKIMKSFHQKKSLQKSWRKKRLYRQKRIKIKS